MLGLLPLSLLSQVIKEPQILTRPPDSGLYWGLETQLTLPSPGLCASLPTLTSKETRPPRTDKVY